MYGWRNRAILYLYLSNVEMEKIEEFCGLTSHQINLIVSNQQETGHHEYLARSSWSREDETIALMAEILTSFDHDPIYPEVEFAAKEAGMQFTSDKTVYEWIDKAGYSFKRSSLCCNAGDPVICAERVERSLELMKILSTPSAYPIFYDEMPLSQAGLKQHKHISLVGVAAYCNERTAKMSKNFSTLIFAGPKGVGLFKVSKKHGTKVTFGEQFKLACESALEYYTSYERVIFIGDNHRIHSPEEMIEIIEQVENDYYSDPCVLEDIQSGKRKRTCLELFWLPRYTPELNLVEFVNGEVKSELNEIMHYKDYYKKKKPTNEEFKKLAKATLQARLVVDGGYNCEKTLAHVKKYAFALTNHNGDLRAANIAIRAEKLELRKQFDVQASLKRALEKMDEINAEKIEGVKVPKSKPTRSLPPRVKIKNLKKRHQGGE